MSTSNPRPLPPPRGTNPAFDQLVDSTLRALDGPGGDEILDRMIAKQMSVPDGLAALAIMSGDYDRRPDDRSR